MRYDNQVGARWSALYENGKLTTEFTAAAEVYVELDEDGNPALSGPRCHADDLVDGVEYETVENAIQRGLASLGRGSWTTLKRVISNA